MPDWSAPVAVTGVGVLTPFGDDLATLGAALRANERRFSERGYALACLAEFDPRRYANVRGMRVYPRNAQLQICAACLALTNAGLSIDPLQLGVIAASTWSHLETLWDYERDLIALGMQRTNPTWMPLALPSAGGALTALALDAKAFALTLSNGGASGLAALGLAMRKLRAGRARACVVVSSFAECRELAQSALRAGQLTHEAGFRVFDRSSQGSALGELAIALVLEPRELAERRGRRALALLSGQACEFAGDRQRLDGALARACRRALECASFPDDLRMVSAGANGQPTTDLAEANALRDLLGERTDVPVTAIKSCLGESFDASALLQVALAIDALHAGMAPPIAALREPVVADLAFARTVMPIAPGSVLVTAIAPSGSCSALVLQGGPS